LFDNVLTKYRFTPREDRPEWSEAAIDPEMLGRAFESLMASRERRDNGAFYTPHALVTRTTDAALERLLASVGVAQADRDALTAGRAVDGETGNAAREALQRARILDPACGSGAFLVHVLERIGGILRSCGDLRPTDAIRRHVLTTSIFGVDINPMAVWLCELRLWLSVVIESDVTDPMQVPPLPNLDRNVRLGDALSGGGWSGAPIDREEPGIARLRGRYARATGRRKAMLARALDGAERRAAVRAVQQRLGIIAAERRELLSVSRGRDLFGGRRGSLGGERQRRDALRAAGRELRAQERALRRGGALPFRFASHFADIQAAGGFDVVIGNPPWVRLHRIPPDRRDAFRRAFRVFRDAAWQAGAAAAGAGAGFAAQVDLAALFAERSVELVRQGGTVALLLPMKLWRSLAGGGVRRLLAADNTLHVVEDWSEAPHAFDAAVYPSLVITERSTGDGTPRPPIVTVVHRKRLAIAWRTPYDALTLDETPGAPWLLLPPHARRVVSRLAATGVTLAASSFGPPMMGVKCGCNDAFLVRALSVSHGEALVATTRGNVRMDADALRPVLRGEGVRRWRSPRGDESIVWTHGADGRPLSKLAPAVGHWLARWRSTLAARSDARGNGAWWSLFRVDGAVNDRPRVVWADMSRGPRACVLPAGSPIVPLNTCYVLRCRDDADAAALVVLLNSPLMACWLDAVAEPARGGFRRYMAWTIARMPLPRDWSRARDVLAPIGARAVQGDVPGDPEVLAAACAAFGLSTRTVAPLLEWGWR
jgi:SAM-dependent methyltransferase